jgi:hypothetical protein
MPAVDLFGPARPDLNLAIPGRRTVPNHKMVSQAVLHFPGPPVIGVKNPRIPLPG